MGGSALFRSPLSVMNSFQLAPRSVSSRVTRVVARAFGLLACVVILLVGAWAYNLSRVHKHCIKSTGFGFRSYSDAHGGEVDSKGSAEVLARSGGEPLRRPGKAEGPSDGASLRRSARSVSVSSRAARTRTRTQPGGRYSYSTPSNIPHGPQGPIGSSTSRSTSTSTLFHISAGARAPRFVKVPDSSAPCAGGRCPPEFGVSP
jgi:hypothetical protein